MEALSWQKLEYVKAVDGSVEGKLSFGGTLTTTLLRFDCELMGTGR